MSKNISIDIQDVWGIPFQKLHELPPYVPLVRKLDNPKCPLGDLVDDMAFNDGRGKKIIKRHC